MSVRIKALTIISITLAGLIAIQYTSAVSILLQSFRKLEVQRVREQLQQATDAIEKDTVNLGVLVGDWAQWDECDQYMAGRNPGFVDTCINDRALKNLDVNFIAFVDTTGRLIYLKDNFATRSGYDVFAADLRRQLVQDNPLLDLPYLNSRRVGMLCLARQPMLVASQPITNGRGESPARGTVIMGRVLNRRNIDRLAYATRLNLTTHQLSDKNLSPEELRARMRLLRGAKFYSEPINDNRIVGFSTICDLYGKPLLMLGINESRTIFAQGISSLRYFRISLIVISLAFCMTAMLLLEMVVLSRLAKLTRNVKRIGATGNFSERLSDVGFDELGMLSEEVNGMLGALERTHDELVKQESLRNSEERYRTLVELSPDAVFIQSEGIFIFANLAGIELLGASSVEEILGKSFIEVIHPDHRTVIEELFQQLVADHDLPRFETGLVRPDGSLVDVEMTATPFLYQDKRAVQIIAHDITERKRAEERLNYFAYYDGLTGLPNRLLFGDRLQQALARAHRNQETVAVMLLDLDRFKDVNDSLGHSTGDCLLKEVANILESCMRESDTVARMSGDEFTIILPNIGGAQGAEHVAQRILDAFARSFHLGENEMYITTSIGISLYPTDGDGNETLVKNADLAMYRAKSLGRNTYQFFSPEMGEFLLERRMLEGDLRKAIERNELVVFYQPQVDCETGKIIGVEALIRWQHPEMGLLQPQQFIPLAEETGMIIPIDHFVLRKACEQNIRWQQQGLPDLRVAVNLSARHFCNSDLLDIVAQALTDTGIHPASLELEITETMAMQNFEQTLSLLHGLRALGVRIAIDDFGAGYSSLNYIKQFPIHTIKIDRSFIHDLRNDPDGGSLVEAIIAMTHTLRRKVVAEAVETTEQMQFLRRAGCDTLQGFLFGRPTLPEDLTEQINRVCIQPAGITINQS